MPQSLRIIYGPGDELALKTLATYLRDQGIDYEMFSKEEEADHAMVGMPFAYMRADKFAKVIQTNGYLEKTFDIDSEDLYGIGWQKFIHPEDKARLLIILAKEFFVIKTTVVVSRFIIREGVQFTGMIIINSLMDNNDKRVGFRILVIDITEAAEGWATEKEDTRHHLSTQLLSRKTFLLNLHQVMENSRPREHRVAVIEIMLEGLEKINLLAGYEAGDEQLKKITKKLQEINQNKHHLAQLETAKFALIIESFSDEEEVQQFIEKIQTSCTETIIDTNLNVDIQPVLGVAFSSDVTNTAEQIMRHANLSLELAKSSSDEKVVYFDETRYKGYQHAIQVEAHLFNAISQDQFELYYQPQVDAFSGQLVGIEALLRWNHPELGTISPEEFIPIAEASGFITQIGRWVNDRALSQFEVWLTQYYEKMEHIQLSINLSPRQLTDPNLIEETSMALIKYNIPAKHVIYELTEKAVMSDPVHNINVLKQLRHLGVFLSMDDFGTGYSSLNYLRALPLHQVKIDKSFISAMQENMQDAAVVKATILLADALGIEVVAEGVEKEAELEFLRDNGCRVIQGYYFSPPLTGKAMGNYILKHASS